MKTSPERMWHISSTWYCQRKRPLVQDHAITVMAPSWLAAIEVARACGLPSRTHSAGNEEGKSSTVAGLAMTFDMRMPPEIEVVANSGARALRNVYAALIQSQAVLWVDRLLAKPLAVRSSR